MHTNIKKATPHDEKKKKSLCTVFSPSLFTHRVNTTSLVATVAQQNTVPAGSQVTQTGAVKQHLVSSETV